MAYTNPWVTAAPSTGDAANQIWQYIRNVRVDLEDRLEGKFFTDITLDPLLFSTAFLNKVGYGDEEYIIPPTALLGDDVHDFGYSTDVVSQIIADRGFIPLIGFPLGRSMTRVRLLMSVSSGTVTAYLHKTILNYGSPGITSSIEWTSAATSGTGYKLIDSTLGAPFPLTIADAPTTPSVYTIRLVSTGTFSFVGGSVSHSANSF